MQVANLHQKKTKKKTERNKKKSQVIEPTENPKSHY